MTEPTDRDAPDTLPFPTTVEEVRRADEHMAHEPDISIPHAEIIADWERKRATGECEAWMANAAIEHHRRCLDEEGADR